MKVKKKNLIAQLLCKHKYETGVLEKPGEIPFFNLRGQTYTTICVKCGKIIGETFVRNFDE